MFATLSNEQLKEMAPAAFNQRTAGHLSDNYQLVNTSLAVDALRKEGWLPVAANQKRPRFKANESFAKHLIRFRHETAQGIFDGGVDAVGQAFPELVLVNSHNGSSRYQLLAGIFVLACSNGLIVAEEMLSKLSIRHLRSHEEELLQAAEKVSEQLTPIMTRVQGMRAKEMNVLDQSNFAIEALRLKFPAGNSPFNVHQILKPRREQDMRSDLWAVFNRVQENLLAGGTVGVTYGKTGRRFTSRATKDVNVQLKMNQELWTLANRFVSNN